MFLAYVLYMSQVYGLTSSQIAAMPESATQLIVVTPTSGVKAKVIVYQKIKMQWVKTGFSPFAAVVGSAGVARAGEKIEGDKKTPSGLYALGSAFGSEPLALKMDYRYTTKRDKFIDDAKSPEYTTWITGETAAASYEHMRRQDGVYKIGLVVNYNMNPVIPGKGSAIFMHLWYGENIGTTGCVATDEKHLRKLLLWLNKNDMPYILINAQ